MIPQRKKIRAIEKVVGAHFGFTRGDLMVGRSRAIIKARALVMSLVREHTGATFEQIAGNYNRTTSTAQYHIERAGNEYIEELEALNETLGL